MSTGGVVVVVGGSMAGLLAARVLADHFSEVVILDRDAFPATPGFRAGTPHARHAHVLLSRGHQVIERLMPGIDREMREDGAMTFDVARDFSFLSWAGDAVRFESGVPYVAVSRPFLEHHVRRRVLALPNVSLRSGVRLTGLAGTAQRITGVRVHDGAVIEADLVVDASGRESRTCDWLEQLGVARPDERLVKPFLGYASRTYEPPAHTVWDRSAMIAMAVPPMYTRGVAVVPIEQGRYIVTLIGINGDYPPTAPDAYEAFARSLPIPAFHAWLDHARPAGEIHGFRHDQSRLRAFESCALPEGYLAVGDAVCSFNPIYGQGMTMAAIGAETLADVLAAGTPRAAIGRAFHRRLARVLRGPWESTTAEDLRYPGTEGPRTLAQRIAYAYIDRLFVRCSHDVVVRRALIDVFGLTRSARHLFRPSLVARVLATSIPRGLVRPQHAPARGTLQA